MQTQLVLYCNIDPFPVERHALVEIHIFGDIVWIIRGDGDHVAYHTNEKWIPLRHIKSHVPFVLWDNQRTSTVSLADHPGHRPVSYESANGRREKVGPFRIAFNSPLCGTRVHFHFLLGAPRHIPNVQVLSNLKLLRGLLLILVRRQICQTPSAGCCIQIFKIHSFHGHLNRPDVFVESNFPFYLYHHHVVENGVVIIPVVVQNLINLELLNVSILEVSHLIFAITKVTVAENHLHPCQLLPRVQFLSTKIRIILSMPFL